MCLWSTLARLFSLGFRQLSPGSPGEGQSPPAVSLSGVLAVLFLTLAFKSSEAVTLADGHFEPGKGQNHQIEPDRETAALVMEAGAEV